MQLRRPAILKTIFLLTSSFLAFFAFYSADVYIRVYASIRDFDVPTPEFEVIILNNSYASTETTITLQNPSKSKFELVSIEEGIYLDGEFITIGRFSGRQEIHPMSEITTMIKTDIPHYRIHYVTEKTERTWLVTVRITLNAEIVGTFPWRRSWLITDV